MDQLIFRCMHKRIYAYRTYPSCPSCEIPKSRINDSRLAKRILGGASQGRHSPKECSAGDVGVPSTRAGLKKGELRGVP